MSDKIHVPEEIKETAYTKPVVGDTSNAKVKEYVTGLLKADGKTDADVADMQSKGVFARMKFGANPSYYAVATGGGHKLPDGTEVIPDMPPSKPIINLIIPRLHEVYDMEGDKDPSSQMSYAVLDGGALHKYNEIILAHIVTACSAHCRFCFRLDLFNSATRKETGKGIVSDPTKLRDYIRTYNAQFNGEETIFKDGRKHYRLKEVLLSGGDPMVLPNKKLYEYMSAAAEGGVDTVRIGTKELAFRPERFDGNFREMLKLFHNKYPNVHVHFAVHFSHPDEFLFRDKNNQYVREGNQYKWMEYTKNAIKNLRQLGFVSLENQTPIVKDVNNDSKALHILHAELRRNGVRPKYVFGCRHIEGHKAFAVPVEEAWRIHAESQKGLSDIARSRFSLSTFEGKLEVVSVIDKVSEATLNKLPAESRDAIRKLLGEGLIVFKIQRAPAGANNLSDVIIAKRNPQALWIDDYDDRLIYDGRKTDASQNKYLGLLATLATIGDANIINKMTA